jgi:hypothetical protein
MKLWHFQHEASTAERFACRRLGRGKRTRRWAIR